MSDLSVGSTVAGCRLESVAGRGGMGVVYRATQLALERPVALKAMAPLLARDVAYRERFQRESHLAASIDHPNVIPVYEAGEIDGTLYLIMRWVDGTDLRALLTSSGRLPPAHAVRLLRPVASALAAAHRRGLVHRDVKPANVLIARTEDEDDDEGGHDEHVYLTDFGIARRTDGEGLTRTGVLVGTLDYTAPERIEGGMGTPASDIYSFGCMLFEALTGHVPFVMPTDLAKMHAHLNLPVPSARAETPSVPEQLEAVLAKSMAKRPEERFASAGELASALGRAVGEVPARDLTPVPPTKLADVAPTPATELGSTTPAATEPLPPAAPAPGPAATPEPAPTRSSRSRGLIAVPLVLLTVGAIVAVVATSGGGQGSPPGGPATTPGGSAVGVGAPQVLQGAPGVSIGPAVDIRAQPSALAAAGANVSVGAHAELAQVGSGGVASRTDVIGDPSSVTAESNGRVWMTGVGPTGVTVVNPASGAKTNIAAGHNPVAVAISQHAAWIADAREPTVTRVDLSSLTPTPIAVAGPPAAIGEAYGRIWVASKTGSVTVLDDNGTPDSTAGPHVPGTTVAIAQSNGVWFLGSLGGSDGTLTRVDPRASMAVATAGSRQFRAHPEQAAVGPAPVAMGALANDNSVWVLSRGDRTLTRFATSGAHNNAPIAQVRFSASPGQLAVGDHVAWVSMPSTGQVYPIRFS